MNRPIPSEVRCRCEKSPAKSTFFRGLMSCASASGTSGRPIAGDHSCNTVWVGARREDAPDSSTASREPLGAPPAGYGKLGPVSPELALVDHVLAERLRMLLPEPHERPRPVRRMAEAPRPRVPPPRRAEMAPSRVVRRRSRWRRTIALALLIFTGGAASGGLLGRGPEVSPPTPLQAQANLSTMPAATDSERSGAETTSDGGSTAPRLERSGPRSSTWASTRERRRAAAATWAANVLGVTVGIDGRGVRLVWDRPTESNHVVVIRKLVSHRHSVVVFRGQATSFRDVSASPCTAYRYVIINYDGRGQPSTGVRTSIVTQGCGRKAPRRSSA
jgi:hypothetical protein